MRKEIEMIHAQMMFEAAPTTGFYNLLFLGLLGFGIIFFFVGLFGRMGAITVLNGKNTLTAVLMAIGGTLLCAGLVVWGAMDLLKGPVESLVTKWVGNLANGTMNTTINPWGK